MVGGLFRFMREKKWTFDPTAPEKIPPFLHAALEAHGVCREQVKLVFPGDYSRSFSGSTFTAWRPEKRCIFWEAL